MSASARSSIRPLWIAAAVLLLLGASPPIDDSSRSPDQARLGKLLFFDARLSAGNGVSCASCHDPKRGWTDQLPVAVGAGGGRGRRNTPTLLNARFLGNRPDRTDEGVFWDGRAVTLEDQVHFPISAGKEMGASPAEAVRAIAAIPGYRPYFRSAFEDETVTMDRIARAIAAFERTLVSSDSPYDRYFLAVDTRALSSDAVQGLKLFFGDARCSICHDNERFSDMRFHNTGVGGEAPAPDLGRYEVTKKDSDRGAFKTPSLRNLRYTAPYMHDGSFKTLEEIVEFYDRGGIPSKWTDPDLVPLYLTQQQKRQLLAFLDTLNSDPRVMDAPAELPR